MGLVMPDIFWADKESLELYTDSAGGKDRCFGIETSYSLLKKTLLQTRLRCSYVEIIATNII
jgi:hypothetical protein